MLSALPQRNGAIGSNGGGGGSGGQHKNNNIVPIGHQQQQRRQPPDLARLERSLTEGGIIGIGSVGGGGDGSLISSTGSCSSSSGDSCTSEDGHTEGGGGGNEGGGGMMNEEGGNAENAMGNPSALLMGVDARTRFSASKALFERMERQQGAALPPPPPSSTATTTTTALPCFYSPRLQRSNSAGMGGGGGGGAGMFLGAKKPPPVPPPKPAAAGGQNGGIVGIQLTPSASANSFQQQTTNEKQPSTIGGTAPSTKCHVPGSPLSQLARNFSQFASDVERIAREPRGPAYGGEKAENNFSPQTVGPQHFGSTHRQMDSEENSPPSKKAGGPLNYDAYWRRPAYYRDRLFGSIERGSGGTKAEYRKGGHPGQSPSSSPPNGGSESGEDSVPSEPRPSSASPAKKEEGPSRAAASTVETMRGLSPERDSAMGRKISFSTAPIRVYKTHGIEEYDRRNDDIDPVASCAEYELERRLERMECFDVQLEKGPEGLGVSIIGMGVGADAGLEKLGIFVKSITPGGAVHRDGRIQCCDQIVSVDGHSLVGVSQLFAAQTLRSTGNRVQFTIGRERDLEGSEVAQLIRQSLEQDRLREAQRQRLEMAVNGWGGEKEEMGGIGRGEEGNGGDGTQSSGDEQNCGQEEEEMEMERRRGNANARQIGHSNVAEKMKAISQSSAQPFHSASSLASNKSFGKTPPSLKSSILPSPAKIGGSTFESTAPIADPVPAIRSRIQTLESALEQQRRKADEMNALLENTRVHYSQLESRYNQARDIVKSFQEREREMLRREESHVEQMRTKEREYADLVGGLRGRIEELEKRLEAMAGERARLEEGELSELRERLEREEGCAGAKGAASLGIGGAQQQERQQTAQRSPRERSNANAAAAPALPAHRGQQQIQQQQRSELALQANGHNAPAHRFHPHPQHHPYNHPPPQGIIHPHPADVHSNRQFRPIGLRHAGLAAHSVPLSAASPSLPLFHHSPPTPARPLLIHYGGGGSARGGPPAAIEDFSASDPSKCPQSPVPRVSEPASPALPQKWAKHPGAHNAHPHGRHLGIFPLRRRFVPAENEFWRENQEAQGLAVLQWTVDDVCQLLIHVGLEKYIPEFTVNQINGPKFLELDGSKLKAMGIFNHSERAVIKKRVKGIKQRIERERKALEKEAKARNGGVKIVSMQ